MEKPMNNNQMPDHPIHVFMRMMPENLLHELWNVAVPGETLTEEKFFARVYNGLQEAFRDEQTFKVGNMHFGFFAEWARGKDEPPTYLQLSVLFPGVTFYCDFVDYKLSRSVLNITLSKSNLIKQENGKD